MGIKDECVSGLNKNNNKRLMIMLNSKNENE